MGLGSYFKNPIKRVPNPPDPKSEKVSEKAPTYSRYGDNDSPLQTPAGGSSRASLRTPRSERSSYLVDEIKHEVMCNYLHQQQCGNLWVSDNSGRLEGVLLRKKRNEYLSCPPALAASPFALAVSSLNVQVSTIT